MPRLPVQAGAYQSRAIIASAQRCVNLYPEINEDPTAPVPVTHFPTVGLTLLGTPPVPGVGRKIYRASNGDVYAVINNSVYFIDANFNWLGIGNIPASSTPVSMCDNGIVAVIVDGTSTWTPTSASGGGWAINLADHSFAPINDPNFLGATTVAYVDGFFIFNLPFKNEWYISLPSVGFANLTQGVITPPALQPAFDSLDNASKTGWGDPVAAVHVMHRNIWTIGTLETEVWYNAGAADFVFSAMPGVYVHHGTIAPYSVASNDLELYWLGQDKQGTAVVFSGAASFQVKVVSSRGLEAIIGKMPNISDAIGNCYQVLGHPFYVLQFPSAGRTFAMDIASQNQWHELAYTGPNGLERHRGNSWCFGYGKVLCLDYANGKIYQSDPNAFTDAGAPITRIRTIPHLLNDGKRVRLDRVLADAQGGTLGGNQNPEMSIRVSLDRGGSFQGPLISNFGDTGDYGAMPWWPGLGIARDFVLEVSWSAPIDTAFNGIFYDATPAGT